MSYLWIVDISIAIAYFVIPLQLLYHGKKEDIIKTPLVILFVSFILACGTTHLIRSFPESPIQNIFLIVSGILTSVV